MSAGSLRWRNDPTLLLEVTAPLQPGNMELCIMISSLSGKEMVIGYVQSRIVTELNSCHCRVCLLGCFLSGTSWEYHSMNGFCGPPIQFGCRKL
ncbi:hypothetical protein OPV22_002429 [Ensete ventricosum]|uniref:Uncharacterized protein n=1 Tax=Ensete ventricosum TaxID=4639 RepID=A0AAV8RXU1_ENSVE|nr:hypothetical protein OPV22_002429 [Ensete ventricosum]